MSSIPHTPPAASTNIKTYKQIIFVLLLLFLVIAALVQSGSMKFFDSKILTIFFDQKSSLFSGSKYDEVMRDCTSLGGSVLLTLFTLLGVIYFIRLKQHSNALFLGLAVISSSLLSNTLKRFFDLPRPDLFPHGAAVHSASFPSSHTLSATTAYLAIALLMSQRTTNPTHKHLIFVAASLVIFLAGVSRVSLQVHWPSDVLASWTLGTAWVLVCWCIKQTMETALKR